MEPHSAPFSGYTLLGVGLALLVVGLNGFFVAAEFALVRVRPSRLRALAKRGSRRAQVADRLAHNLDETLSVCQVGITLTSLALGWIGEPVFATLMRRLLGPADPLLGTLAPAASMVTAFVAITFLHVVLGELVPKSIAIALAERVAIALAAPLRLCQVALYPLVLLLNPSARAVLRPLNLGDASEHADPGLDELKLLLQRAQERGTIGAGQALLIENLFPFAARRAREVMVPLSRVVMLDVTQPWPELRRTIEREGYSRFPLHSGDADRISRVLHIKALLPALGVGRDPGDLMALAQPAPVIPQTLSLERLLTQLQSTHAHMAVVANEYGNTVGIITLEDVLEELVGELRDEFDAEEVDPIRPRPDGGYLLDPAVALDRALDLIGDAPELPEGVHTVGGLLQAELGRVPVAGDHVPFGSRHNLVAVSVQGPRILEVALVPSTPGNDVQVLNTR
jgi:CBS domain containing-hemolysin-like protein